MLISVITIPHPTQAAWRVRPKGSSGPVPTAAVGRRATERIANPGRERPCPDHKKGQGCAEKDKVGNRLVFNYFQDSDLIDGGYFKEI